MGGIGSGLHWGNGWHSLTTDYRSIDVRRWKRDGLLEPGRAFGWKWTLDGEDVASIRARVEHGQVRLLYRQRSGGGDWQDMDYPVALSWTHCHMGGRRPWFLCPALGCGRRVALLYGGAVFACRRCHQLAYPSQREHRSDRASRRAERIRAKLGWEPGMLNGWGLKPKGMHWCTFKRLCAEHDDWEYVSLAAVADRLGIAMPDCWEQLLE